jgi:hypothetical protein
MLYYGIFLYKYLIVIGFDGNQITLLNSPLNRSLMWPFGLYPVHVGHKLNHIKIHCVLSFFISAICLYFLFVHLFFHGIRAIG